jgi:23S rRNA (guanine2445-N2)-methyltransferase / 23S rRNA (guanine2069-N7)-methyltransferase
MIFVTVSRGLEPLLVTELQNLGLPRATIQAAGVSFEGELRDAYRVVLFSRLGSRVLWPLASFRVRNEDDLYKEVRRIRWPDHLAADGTIAVRTTSLSGAIANTHFASLKVKDAIVDAMRDATGERPNVDTMRPDLRIQLHLDREQGTLSLDLAGESLHRRGYRVEAGEAPLREDVAASILLRSGWTKAAQSGAAFLDPFCGSGTLPIEAAMLAADIAPGLLRGYHGFSGWEQHDADVWRKLTDEAEQRRAQGLERLGEIRGSDRDPAMVEIARENVARAGLTGRVSIEMGDACGAGAAGAEKGLIVTNPPYGRRLGNRDDLVDLYREFGQRLLSSFGGWDAAILTEDRELGREIGLRPRRRALVMNGSLECHLLRFRIHRDRLPADGSGRRPKG